MAKTTKTAVKRTPTKVAKTAKPTTAQKNARTKSEVAAADANANTAPTQVDANGNAAGAAEVTRTAATPTDTRSPAELAQAQELGQTLADHSLEVHQAAAGNAQGLAAPYAADGVVAATNERVDAIHAAVQARNAEALEMTEKNAKAAEGHEAQRVENVSVPLDSAGAKEAALRVPEGLQKPAAAYAPQGISPDVTSPVTGPVVQVPGTGVAKLSELAPGQSLAPSPPISSSNILPQPDKPSFG